MDVADELYALPPGEFTAARDAQIATAKNAGDKALAAQLAALKRPTVGAWLVNVVALRRPEDLRRLFEAAEAIRTARGPSELREQGQRRRREIDHVLGVARQLASEAGAPEPTRAQLAEVESTLTAAMADQEAADLVGRGRVLKALSYGGFGGFGDLGGAFVTTGSAGASATGRERSKAPAAEPEDQEAERAAARASAEAMVVEAEQELRDAIELEAEARRVTDRLTAEIDTLRQQLDEADRAVRVARHARLSAERDLAMVRRKRDRL